MEDTLGKQWNRRQLFRISCVKHVTINLIISRAFQEFHQVIEPKYPVRKWPDSRLKRLKIVYDSGRKSRSEHVKLKQWFLQHSIVISFGRDASTVELFNEDIKVPDTSSIQKANVPIIWVLGGPGSGKGTQCDKIVAKYGFTHISTGDLLRAEVSSGSERGKALDKVMKEGQLVSSEVVMALLAEKMLKELDSTKGYLIDGYPRELTQGQQFEKLIGKCKLVLYFEGKDETLVERLLFRAKTSGREDDNEETIKKRLDTFHSHNDPIVQEYASVTKTISAEDTPENIFAQVEASIDAILK